ncbi:Root adhesin [Limihaloglobus sulfuriphilus]|uniref:Root adhesin n=1 Tax=Limihaloglobus sulfuriphilus TaxID=1851148 RepID=A0A1Q2MJ73_9BACT|nr:OmpA family protein [Limihaloglobus sulfuriphilus]AQQ72457.1 Root adhesin [Limihaloglobus sulfuriphilus]
MNKTRFLIVVSIAAAALMTSGCVAKKDYDSLRMQNRLQAQQLSNAESELRTAKLEVEKLQKQLDAIRQSQAAGKGACSEEIALLETAIAEKNELIKQLQDQLLKSGGVLPTELNMLLEEFAAGTDMVEFDEETGSLKFKSDLLFEPGSDKLSSSAVKSIETLCAILNSQEAADFDAIIAGHTDDMRIAKPATRQKHPTNWHLSTNRAISVIQEMTDNGIAPQRLSARGFGEYRPIAENKPNNRGNEKNRRVEIYIVPKGK